MRTLIHLISEQTMQNLLPVLALRPDRVVSMRSPTERFKAAAASIESAVREAGLTPEFLDCPLPSKSPDPGHVQQAINQWLTQHPDAIVNITGGTKLMSLGAWLGAEEFPRSVILYCDSDRQTFLSVGANPLPEAIPDFGATARQLTLRTVMAAHGKLPDEWKFDSATPQLLDFGRQAFTLRWDYREDFSRSGFGQAIRGFFRSDKGRIPSARTKLDALVAADISGAFRDPLPRPVHQFLDAAVTAGLLRQEGDAIRLAPPPAGENPKSHVERSANILDGSWLELSVLDFIRNSARFADAHWSVEPRKAQTGNDSATFGETDIVCLTLPQGALQVISCKTVLRQPLEHIEALRERASTLGGRYARAMLAVLEVSPNDEVRLRRWGRLLNVEILIGSEISSLKK